MPSVINQTIASRCRGDENKGRLPVMQEELSDVTFGITFKQKRNAVMFTALHN